MAEGTLTIIPTPIGNLKDITLRALEKLKEADLILAEDTRTSGVLLKHYDIHTPMESHHKFNEYKQAEGMAQRIAGGLRVALISDAGTPLVSDPGSYLVKACIEQDIKISCLPGPTALVPALVMSGLSAERFAFEGFLPVKKGRKSMLEALASEPRTLIFYESPFRVVRTLHDLGEYFGKTRQAATVRELSKIYETVQRGTLEELAAYYEATPPKGEFVLLVEGTQHLAEMHKKELKKQQTE